MMLWIRHLDSVGDYLHSRVGTSSFPLRQSAICSGSNRHGVYTARGKSVTDLKRSPMTAATSLDHILLTSRLDGHASRLQHMWIVSAI